MTSASVFTIHSSIGFEIISFSCVLVFRYSEPVCTHALLSVVLCAAVASSPVGRVNKVAHQFGFPCRVQVLWQRLWCKLQCPLKLNDCHSIPEDDRVLKAGLEKFVEPSWM